MLTTLLQSVLELDKTLAGLAVAYGPWLYALLFAVIFAETGLVVFPFLPGDSLLFIAGTVVAMAGLNVHFLVAALIVAAVSGDSVNHTVGRIIGPKVFDKPDSRWFKQEHLRRTQAFYDKYGGVTIIIGRFVPIVRTFAPFLAGRRGNALSQVRRLLARRQHALDILAGLRRLPVRQHSLGQEQPVADRRRHRRGLAHPGGVDLVARAEVGVRAVILPASTQASHRQDREYYGSDPDITYMRRARSAASPV